LLSSVNTSRHQLLQRDAKIEAVVLKPAKLHVLERVLRETLGRSTPPSALSKSESTARENVVAADSSATPSPRAEESLLILVAEDNPVNQRVMLKMLEKLGHRADIASDGELAVAAVTDKRYDLVLMDVQMPRLDGLAATRRIREILPRDRQPFIMALTANAMKDDELRCLAAGMDGFLSKPVQLQPLRDALARLTAKS
jgi:CheY-like chemotaxis protein